MRISDAGKKPKQEEEKKNCQTNEPTESDMGRKTKHTHAHARIYPIFSVWLRVDREKVVTVLCEGDNNAAGIQMWKR